MSASVRESVGIVAIGRNEGERLVRCLRSAVGQVKVVVYVDSGSTDSSVKQAREIGALVVELDMRTPFTAARARNEGIRYARNTHPELEFIQVVDGDCELVHGWLQKAHERLAQNESLAVVCGRRREEHPDASVYNKLCDMEWNTPVGFARACGGDAMFRLSALESVHGYDPALIAGEEPELCHRLLRSGWKIERLDADMTLHDAQITGFAQWWKRMVRSGHAYAEGRAMHGAEGYCVREVRSIIEWTVLLPAIAFGLAWLTWGLSLLLLAGYLVLIHRVRRHRLQLGESARDALLYAHHCVLGKFAQLFGFAKYWLNRVLGRRSRLIEYKQVAPASQPLVPEGGRT